MNDKVKKNKVLIIPLLTVIMLSSLGAALYVNDSVLSASTSSTYPLTLDAMVVNMTLQPDTEFTRGETAYIWVNLSYPAADYYASPEPIDAYIVVSVTLPDYSGLAYIYITTLNPGDSFQVYTPFPIQTFYPLGEYRVDVLVLSGPPGDPGATLLAPPMTLTFYVIS